MSSLLPCPLAGQGECSYRRAYGCTDKAQEASRRVLGHCLPERYRYTICVRKGLQLVGRASWEEATADEQARIAAWAEAWVYEARVQAYVLMRMVDEVTTPSQADVLRYQLAACNAEEARFKALVPDLLNQPDLPEAA